MISVIESKLETIRVLDYPMPLSMCGTQCNRTEGCEGFRWESLVSYESSEIAAMTACSFPPKARPAWQQILRAGEVLGRRRPRRLCQGQETEFGRTILKCVNYNIFPGLQPRRLPHLLGRGALCRRMLRQVSRRGQHEHGGRVLQAHGRKDSRCCQWCWYFQTCRTEGIFLIWQTFGIPEKGKTL